MDRRGKIKESLNRVIEKVSSVDAGYDKAKGIVAGFVPACEFVENGEIISNLAYLLSKRDLAVCVLDLKVFYPNLFDWLGGAEADKKGEGLIRLLNSDRTEVKSVASKTDDENVFLVSPSPNDDIEDYFNFGIGDVKRVITLLKESFDAVLIDIPNNPPLEFCLGALMNCQRGFFVASERIDAPRNIQKLLEYALRVTDGARSFDSIIVARRQELPYDEGALSNLEVAGSREKLRVVARLPYLRAVQEYSLAGKVYARDATVVKKAYARELSNLARIITE